jgi:CheY-like chemotaxis protein
LYANAVTEKPPADEERTVLVVDDEEISRKVFIKALTRLGYTVLEAANTEEALTLCRHSGKRLDLVIADFVLTDGKGTDLAVRVREHCPDVPVLLTSGTPLDGWSDAERRRYADLGVRADFLQKPFQIRTLDSKLKDLLSLQ